MFYLHCQSPELNHKTDGWCRPFPGIQPALAAAQPHSDHQSAELPIVETKKEACVSGHQFLISESVNGS